MGLWADEMAKLKELSTAMEIGLWEMRCRSTKERILADPGQDDSGSGKRGKS